MLWYRNEPGLEHSPYKTESFSEGLLDYYYLEFLFSPPPLLLPSPSHPLPLYFVSPEGKSGAVLRYLFSNAVVATQNSMTVSLYLSPKQYQNLETMEEEEHRDTMSVGIKLTEPPGNSVYSFSNKKTREKRKPRQDTTQVDKGRKYCKITTR